ncbi:MAG: hypothetical protein JST22_14910 [Bacteroidetes bacterium]|nr:hypothetical protein [Bacteroidota bacterium]
MRLFDRVAAEAGVGYGLYVLPALYPIDNLRRHSLRLNIQCWPNQPIIASLTAVCATGRETPAQYGVGAAIGYWGWGVGPLFGFARYGLSLGNAQDASGHRTRRVGLSLDAGFGVVVLR